MCVEKTAKRLKLAFGHDMASSSGDTSAVKLFGPLGDGISELKLLRVSGTELDVVNAARVSLAAHHDVFDGSRDAGLISYLARHNHSSPFEHVTMSFRVKAPIFVARQWMRHRWASYNEVSARYTEVADQYYTPKCWRKQSKSNRQVGDLPFKDDDLACDYEVCVEDAFETYRRLLAAGVCREQARAVLPVACYTEFYFSCNLLALVNFLRLRLAEDAQWEIRQYAEEIVEATKDLFPHSYKAWGILKQVLPSPAGAV